MRTKYGILNGFHIKGKVLKRLIFSSSGVLVYEGKRLTFVSLPEMKMAFYEPVDYGAEEKVVFASNQFNKIQQLDDDEPYLIIFTKGLMQIHYKYLGENPIYVEGQTL